MDFIFTINSIVSLILLISFITLLVLLVLYFNNKEKIYLNEHKILTNEIKIKLNEHYLGLSDLIKCATDFSKLSSESMCNLLEYLKDKGLSYMLVSNLNSGELENFNITFKIPYDGYLSFECSNCEMVIKIDLKTISCQKEVMLH